MDRLEHLVSMLQNPGGTGLPAGAGWAGATHMLLVAGACLALLGAVSLVTRAVRRAVDDGNDEVTSDAERRAETLSSVLTNASRVLVIIFFLLMTLDQFGVNIGPLVAGAGVAGVALGFGAQSLVKDVISGFFLLMENQFGVGDIIKVNDAHSGSVERMTLRITQLRDYEGKVHFVPNGAMTSVIVLSKEFARAVVDVEVAYDTDPDRAFQVLREVGDAHLAERPDLVFEPMEIKGIDSLNPNGYTIRTVTKTAPGSQWDVAREVRYRILRAFQAAGIEIPFPQRVMHHRGEPSSNRQDGDD